MKINDIHVKFWGKFWTPHQKSIVTSKALAEEVTGLDENGFNCIVSDRTLSIPEA